jgi:hypothetical protein
MFSVSVPASWAADTMKTLYSFTGGLTGAIRFTLQWCVTGLATFTVLRFTAGPMV